MQMVSAPDLCISCLEEHIPKHAVIFTLSVYPACQIFVQAFNSMTERGGAPVLVCQQHTAPQSPPHSWTLVLPKMELHCSQRHLIGSEAPFSKLGELVERDCASAV